MASSRMTGHCFLVALFLLSVTANGQLSETFYAATCPGLQEIIKTEVTSALSTEKRMGASLLRLLFHDCFVQGCDASVLLDSTVPNSERDANPNANSLRGFNVIDTIKAKVEANCSGVVSCADILALATRQAVVQLGGPTWTLLLGRRDSTTANKAQAENDLPSPSFSIDQLKAAFQKKGLNPNELAALSGAHTIGLARCTFAANPLAVATRPECVPMTGMTSLDEKTPEVFDNKYYVNVANKTGLLKSDQELMNEGKLRKLVNDYKSTPTLFTTDFASAMKKLSELGVLTGTNNGQIRANCNKVNSN